MSKRTRVFVFVASSILLVGLGSAGVASYVGLQNIRLLGGTVDELAYVPASATLVAYADVQQILQSEVGRKLGLLADSEPHPGADHVLQEVGVDVRKDVTSALFVALPDAPAAGNAVPSAFALVRGHFDYPRIEAVITQHGGTIDVYQGSRMATFPVPNAGPTVVIAFAENDLMAIGEPKAVKQGLDTKIAGVGGVKDNDELLGFIKRVDGGSSWAVARPDALQQKAPLLSNMQKQLPSVSWFAAQGTVDDHVAGRLYAQAKDEQAAKDLREVVRGLLAFGRMQAGQQPDFTELLNSIELSGEGSEISVAFLVPPSILDKLTPRVQAPRPGAPDAAVERAKPAGTTARGSI